MFSNIAMSQLNTLAINATLTGMNSRLVWTQVAEQKIIEAVKNGQNEVKLGTTRVRIHALVGNDQFSIESLEVLPPV